MLRKNQKGFTIVELIIAVAILAVVTLAVCGFIVVGSRSYTSTNTDIMLQQEAQLALNQISDVIIDTTDSINYSVGTSSGGLQPVLKDSEYGGEATDKCLTVVNRKDADSNNDNPSYWFYWLKDEETIYFNEVPSVNPDSSPAEKEAAFEAAETGKAVLAEHVTDLNIDISQFEANRVVMISMTLENGNRTYSTSNNITVRNKIALNVVNVDPMTRIDPFTIDVVQSVVLEPGDVYEFVPTVDTSAGNSDLVWEFYSSGHDPSTTYTQVGNNCTLSVSINEEIENITLRVSRDESHAYEGQNDRVAKLVQVYIKRVDSVNLHSTDIATVRAGDTITIEGEAVGKGLGTKTCIAHPADDITKDKDLTGWTFVEGVGTITPSADGKKAVVKIDQSMAGKPVTIEATSVLSANKNGGYSSALDTNPSDKGVQGRITFTVEGESDVPYLGDLRYGLDNYKFRMYYTFMADEAGMSNFPYYIICARLRAEGNNDPSQDWVILYDSNVGHNARFTPDIFGADINKNYTVYLQLILPVDTSLYKDDPNKYANQYQNTDKDDAKHHPGDLLNEYFGHLDRNGAYVGTKYEKSGMYSGSIGKPVVYYKTKEGTTYPSSDPADVVNCYLTSSDTTIVSAVAFDFDATINIDIESGNKLNGKTMFSVYDDGWNLVAGYDYSTRGYKNNCNFAQDMLHCYQGAGGGQDLTGGQPLVSRNSNQNGSLDKAGGTYYVVLDYLYACDENPRNYTFMTYPGDSNHIYTNNGKSTVRGDYSEHYFENRENALKLVVKSDLNLNVITNSENWWTDFPVPSDKQFPFVLKSSAKQTTTWSFKKYNDSKSRIGDLKNVKVECEYKNSDNSYDITILAETANGATQSYGTYNCEYGGVKWTCKKPGVLESSEPAPIIITLDGTNWKTYFPLPSANDFPFKRGSTTEQKISYQLTLDSGNEWYIPTYTVDIVCTYNNGTYTIKIFKPDWGNAHWGTWTCPSNGTQWTKIG